MNFADYEEAMREKRVIHIVGDINNDRFADFHKQLYAVLAEPSKDDIVIGLNTGGGSIFIGMAIFHDLIALQQTRKLWLICQGRIQSMGIYIMLAVPKERRVANPLTEWYCHDGKMSQKIDLYGTPDQHEVVYKEYGAAIENMRREQRELAKLMAANTSINEEKAWELTKNPRRIYEEEAVKFGFIDHVLEGGKPIER